MDVSDGLAGDLAKMMRASGASAVVELAQVPVSTAARKLVDVDGGFAATRIVTGGDDYEILCTVPPTRLDSFRKEADRVGIPIAVIGQVVPGDDMPVFRLGEVRKTVRCRFIRAFLTAPRPYPGDRLAKRNALVLACAQALGGANPAIVVSLGGIVGQMLADNKQFATVPVSLSHLGLALGTIPAAMLMRRAGRRTGYVIGGSIGVLAGCMAAFGIASTSFLIFCLGTFIAGFYSSFIQSYRFAAADTASEGFRPRAIAWVMSGGIAAGIVGPQTVIWTQDMIPGVAFAGAFLGQAGLALVAILVVSFLRAPPVVPNADTQRRTALAGDHLAAALHRGGSRRRSSPMRS